MSLRLNVRKSTSEKLVNRLTKKIRIRKVVKGTDERPRLCIFRSGKHIYAQLVNDVTGHTLMTVSSLGMDKKSGIEMAKVIGAEVAKKAKESKIEKVVFDRNGFIYHGRVKAVADGAREAGLNF